MAESVYVNFPRQDVSDLEKDSMEYGQKVAEAINSEWFNNEASLYKYVSNVNNFHRLRLYARGEQPVQKYKDELSINGDLSYLNLDWKPVPIISKFVDIVVNGISERLYDVKAYSQSPNGVQKRTEYMENILADMRMKEFNEEAKKEFGVDTSKSDIKELPQTDEELGIHMQLTYKQSVELAEEQAIRTLLKGSNYDLIQKRLYYDITTLGIAAVKTDYNHSEGAVVKYVDPADLIYSHSDSPYFDDIYYVGEVKDISINELVREFPNLTDEDIKSILDTPYVKTQVSSQRYARKRQDRNRVQVVYFNYKTYNSDVFKIKTTGSGGQKAISCLLYTSDAADE